MQNSEWLEKYFEKVAQSSPEGRQAVDYVRAHKTRVGITRARKSVGAFWTLARNFYLNSRHYTRETALENPRAWTLFVHEVRHLQQGPFTALSIYGELEAWLVEFNLYKRLTGKPLHAVLEELLSLPLNMERNNLRRARALMMQFAGKGYGANWLPLYPIHKEIKYWVTRR
ncbi:MAG: hypothetical protein QY332_19410 [Anaerolineales bacterium]|nr:MAG: hypothetical protein QY332_19410 [Anaerolineales bacterium]